MAKSFFEHPILNSPYEYPEQHWELDEDGQPTNRVLDSRRPSSNLTPVPRPKKRKKTAEAQQEIDIGDDEQRYKTNQIINDLREFVDPWRNIQDAREWQVTPETQRLLTHWRSFDFQNRRPFFCQIEAIETLIWLTEVAPKLGNKGKRFLEYLDDANQSANPDLARLALKMATGAGKTTVMGMIIAWQTINAVRRPNSKHFTRGFLVVTPGITIKDRLRVLQPNDPENTYDAFQLVPQDLLPEIQKARIVITNYHAFMPRETMSLAKGSRALLEGRKEEKVDTLESDGQMLQRVMPSLMGMKRILVLNDEAHHCYRSKPDTDEVAKLKGDEKQEAKENEKAARVWISGLEAVQRKLEVTRVVDLSATPFFLSGSGYQEGTLFPWTMSDFSLMDAIECGIVKLPRVPISDNVSSNQMPMMRELWKHIGTKMPKQKRKSGKLQDADPAELPTPLQTALEALYGHYETVRDSWIEAGIERDPCFIVVCNNTATSKLVYDYIAGYDRETGDESTHFVPGALPLFSNFDDYGNPLPVPKTLLIDSRELESGEALPLKFRKTFETEIDLFKREIVQRSGDRAAADNIDDATLLREVMNTVGEPGKLGASIRCVVSVAMLSEGWDANTVTHILGVRAFGTQLLCEQVVGRALRRQSYELKDGLFPVEYADIFGIPFDFTAKPQPGTVTPPARVTRIHAVRPERDRLEIRFPRVRGYRTEPLQDQLSAEFTDESKFTLTPDMVGAAQTENRGIIGEGSDITLEHTADMRRSSLIMHLTSHLLASQYTDDHGNQEFQLYPQAKRIVTRWLDECLTCKGGTYPAQLMFREFAEEACERISRAILRDQIGDRPVQAILDPYNPVGSTRHVNFTTSKPLLWTTDHDKCHINEVVCDGNWEAEFCRVVEKHPRVHAYVKNQNLGFEVPYSQGGIARTYIPDFIVQVDDGNGKDDLLNLVVEIKGYRRGDADVKKDTMQTYWIPGVNRLGDFGRWAFAEFTDVYEMEQDFADRLEEEFDKMIEESSSEESSRVRAKPESRDLGGGSAEESVA